jgi:hypothetical protein
MIRLNRVRAASSTGSACIRISENDRIEVIGVRKFMADLAEKGVLLHAELGQLLVHLPQARGGLASVPPISPRAGWNTP